MESNTAEGLLNFINTASSNVKTVLAKPGCFKRNTNHRRFLQKQLKVNTQKSDNGGNKNEIIKKSFKISKAKQRSYTKRKNMAAMNVKPILASQTQSTARGSDLRERGDEYFNHQIFAAQRRDYLHVDSQYLDECRKFNSIVDDIVDNLLESSAKRSQVSMETAQQERMMEASTWQPLVPLNYTRSGSVSSYSSSSEEDFHLENYMSGEELVRSLDISELFVPHEDSNDQMVMENDENFHIETDIIDVQNMPVFENVVRQFSL
eukprot:gene5510-6195_t